MQPRKSRPVDSLGAWPARVAWLPLPLLAGPALASALDQVEPAVRTTASVGMWVAWGVAVIAVLVPRAVSLTVLRLVAPGAVVATAAATAAGDTSIADIVAVGSATVATVVAFSPLTGDAFVDGSSYGPERRMPLRVPTLLLLGPIEAMWAIVAAGVSVGPLLVADRRWVLGGILVAVGVPAAAAAAAALHGLARRWVVFVPAGLVLHDPLTLADPVLLLRRTISRLGPAPTDTVATDLTQRALGLALEAELAEPIMIALARPRREIDEVERTERLLFSPTRPGAVLREASSRRFAVG